MSGTESSYIEYPKISVVVPIRNEEAFIAATLKFILEQDYPKDKLEVLVIIGRSEDRTAAIVDEIAKKDGRIKVLDNPTGLSSGGRTIGAREAGGEIITFIDGHVYIDNDQLLKNTVRLMTQNKVSILSRPQLLETPDNTMFQQAVALARKSIIGHGLDSTIYSDKDDFVNPTSSGASYKREVFDKIGYFDGRFDACEDVDFNFRAHKAGYQAFTSKALTVYYYPRKTLGGLFKQMSRYGTGRFRLARKHPGTLSPATILPPLFVLGLIVMGILSFFSPAAGNLFSFMFKPYVAVIILWSLYLAFRSRLIFFPILIFIYPTIHFGLGWGYLKEAFRTAVGKGIDFGA
jgi:glycosyltransferase involved in cell wall biosynthesis